MKKDKEEDKITNTSIRPGIEEFTVHMLYNALKAMNKDKEREELNSIIPDKELDDAFTNTNFGNITKRDVVRYALLKAACGYYSGHTAQRIINELGLCSKDLKLTKKGKKYLYA